MIGKTTLKAALGATALAAALIAGAAGGALAQATPDFSGVWMIEGDLSTVKTTNGQLPPMKPAAAKLYREHVAARKAGKIDFDSVVACLPHGLPRLMTAAYPIEIIPERGQINFFHEAQHMHRQVYLNEALPPIEELDQNWMGMSVGKWEGDTLVVDTAGFNDKTTIDKAGIPHSTEMRVQERFRLIDGGQRLEDVITVTDPETFTRPWSYKVTYTKQPGRKLANYICTEFNPEGRGAEDNWGKGLEPPIGSITKK